MRGLVERVFVQGIDCCCVRSNVTGLRQTNIDVEAVKRLSWCFWCFTEGDRKVPFYGIDGFAIVINGATDKTNAIHK